MTARTPVEFTKQNVDGDAERCGNEVVVTAMPASTAPDYSGTDITTPTAMPSGGTGIRGWLSAIWTKLNNSIAVTGSFWQTTQPTSDAGPAWTTLLGIAGVRFTSADQSASAAAVITAPGGGLKAVITDVIVSSDTAMSADFSEESGGVLFTIYLPAGGGAQITPRSKLKLSAATKRLMVQTSKAGSIAVTALYYTEA